MGQSAQKPSFTPFGSIFEPIGWINGKPVWPVIGGAEDDGTQSGSDGTDNAEQGEDDKGSEGSGNDAEESGQSANDSDGDKPVTRVEFDRLRSQLSAADKKREEAENKVKKFEDANRSELEKAQKAAEEAVAERDSAREKLRDVGIREAFRSFSDEQKPPFVWHNIEVAMDLLDKDLYAMDDDGKVSGMDKAIKALAKDHAYLLNKETSGDGKSSGGSFNGGKTNTKTTDENKLKMKYRALQGRGGNSG